MSQEPADRPDGVLPGGDPDDVAEESTPGSEGDGPEESYTEPRSPAQGTGEDAEGR